MLTEARAAAAPTERASPADLEGIFHEARQVLRVTGVPSPLRAWGRDPALLAGLWGAMRPNAETRAFEEAADALRAEAVDAADAMGRLSALAKAQLGESQAYQVQGALMLYHYLDAKLLLFASAVMGALDGSLPAKRGGLGSAQLIRRGAPPKMAMMELVEEKPEDEVLRRLFRDLRKTLALEDLGDDYRTLALWPRYLAAAWERLKPIVKTGGYRVACERLGELSRRLARELPYPVAWSVAGESLEGLRAMEKRLPALVFNVALLSLDWEAPELLRRSPFPARSRGGGDEED